MTCLYCQVTATCSSAGHMTCPCLSIYTFSHCNQTSMCIWNLDYRDNIQVGSWILFATEKIPNQEYRACDCGNTLAPLISASINILQIQHHFTTNTLGFHQDKDHGQGLVPGENDTTSGMIKENNAAHIFLVTRTRLASHFVFFNGLTEEQGFLNFNSQGSCTLICCILVIHVDMHLRGDINLEPHHYLTFCSSFTISLLKFSI